MIPKECKRLIEVDFPVASVSKHAAQEKKIFGSHPSMINQWWARRPLAACRAVLLGLMLPDPCDANCPLEFKTKARKVLESLLMHPKDDSELQIALLKFIGDFADWDNANDQQYIRIGRELVKAAHPEETPLVVDPFAGGGSIPLEALRLGCDAFSSDLNPVACLIQKAMLEDIPRYGPMLVEELRKAGAEIKTAAEKDLANFYPPDSDGVHPIAYLWARTVRCEAPDCGAEIPLMRSFWLCKKANRKRALRLVEVDRKEATNDPLHCIWGEKTKALRFEIFTPQNNDEVQNGTVSRAKATCLCCSRSLPPPRVRTQLAERRGGADVEFNDAGNRKGGARLLSVVILKTGKTGKHYRLPTNADYAAVLLSQKRIKEVENQKLPNGLSVLPDEPTPVGGGSGAGRAFSVQKYGMMNWCDLFSARQKVGLITFINKYQNMIKRLQNSSSVFCFIITRLADKNASLVSWDSGRETIGHVFNRQALSMVWDYIESSYSSEGNNLYDSAFEILINVVDGVASSIQNIAQVQLADACSSPMPSNSADLLFTDPPYYDAVPYADLSDFFFVWLKRTLTDHPLLKDPFDSRNPLTPKMREAVQDETKMIGDRAKDRTFFEETMAKAFAEGRRVLKDDGLGCIVFAHKTTEGWEALLSGIIRGGWIITGSWPIATERPGRLRSIDSAALATSVHLVCRPRPENAPVGDWAEVLRELPKRVGAWMERLQNEGVRGADLVFACIGPALEIYSRYSRVETAEGRKVELNEYLEKVWETVGRIALQNLLGTAEARARNGAAGALEEDARLTALFLWTLQSTAQNDKEALEEAEGEGVEDDEEKEAKEPKKGGYSLIYDVVRRFAQPLGINLDTWEGRVIEIEKGVVRLLPVHERAKQLFGDEGAQAMADRIEEKPTGPVQMKLFADEGAAPPHIKGRSRGRMKRTDVSDEALKTKYEATTLDKVHAAMLLQASGRTNALRALIEDQQDKGPEFMRLANALSALYPVKSEEKRLLDAMILSAPR